MNYFKANFYVAACNPDGIASEAAIIKTLVFLLSKVYPAWFFHAEYASPGFEIIALTDLTGVREMARQMNDIDRFIDDAQLGVASYDCFMEQIKSMSMMKHHMGLKKILDSFDESAGHISEWWVLNKERVFTMRRIDGGW